MRSGVYQIVNICNGKSYVGSAINIKIRRCQHENHAREKTHSAKFQNAVTKHGWENFEFLILENCEKYELIKREQYWIDWLDTVRNGYNTREKAESSLGVKRTPEQNKRNSERQKGRKLTDEQKRKVSDFHKGKILTEEHKKKISIAHKGMKKPWSSRKGVPLSKEHKIALSKALKGRKLSEETKKKMSIAHKGRKLSEETRKKMSAARKRIKP